MKKFYLLSVITGIIAGVLLHFLIMRFFPPEWQKYQKQKGHEYGIITQVCPSTGEKFRCNTCHLMSGNVSPFRKHPSTPCIMPLTKITCTVCHRGEGAKLTVEGAHGTDGISLFPLLDWKKGKNRKFWIQSGCASCHISRKDGVLFYDEKAVPDVQKGLEIFISHGCPSCHRIRGVVSFGEVGPDLSKAGYGKKAEEIEKIIVNPQSLNSLSPMPPQNLDHDKLSKIVLFLLSLVGEEKEYGSCRKEIILSKLKTPSLSQHFPYLIRNESSALSGKEWVLKAGCLGCHRIEENSSGVPDLRYSGLLRRREFLSDIIYDAKKLVPGTFMPSYFFPYKVRESIVNYLMTQRYEIPQSPEAIYKGVCSKCHASGRDSKVVVFAKKPPLFEMGKFEIQKEKFLNILIEGKKGSAMAQWGLVIPRDLLEDIWALLKK